MTLTASVMLSTGDWWWQALTSEPMLTGIALAVVCLGLLLVSARALARLGRAGADRPRQVDPARHSRGTATIEFALVIPIMLFFILLLAQTTFVMAGNLFVHYAAFAATRSAIVYIPADFGPTEPPNVLDHMAGAPKFDAIRAAAVLALVPVAGAMADGNAPADAISDGLDQHYQAYGRSPPRWRETLLPNRLHYAHDPISTRVTVMHTYLDENGDVRYLDTSAGGDEFGPREPITVRVEHQLNLSVPIVWALFADDTADGRYSVVAAQYTLTNEGVLDALPPTPALERLEPPE